MRPNALWLQVATAAYLERMATNSSDREFTIEEYERLREEPGYRSELSRGWLVREPQPGAIHGEATTRLHLALDAFVRARGLGRVTNQTGYALTPIPRTVRGPDVAFVRAERVPPHPPASFWPFAPDLAVEVITPATSRSDLRAKIAEYFEAGTSQVWLVDTHTRTVTICRSLDERTTLHEHDLLQGGELIPGFSLPIATLFEW